VKVASAVLRGLGGSNAPRLPDHLTPSRWAFNKRLRLLVVWRLIGMPFSVGRR